MRVAHLSVSDHDGGAPRAAAKIHEALRFGTTESCLFVADTPTKDGSLGFARAGDRLLNWGNLEGNLLSLWAPKGEMRSPALLPSSANRAIAKWRPDLIHIHWVSRRTSSIRQLGKLMREFPHVFSLHDMWPMLGTKHYGDESELFARHDSPVNLIDSMIDRQTFARKLRNWPSSGAAIVPSPWLQEKVARSTIFGDWDTSVIPYPINQSRFFREQKAEARNRLDLPRETKLLLFASKGGEGDLRKGWDLLVRALEKLNLRRQDFGLITVGNFKSENYNLPFPAYAVGGVNSDTKLRNLYSASDVLLLPSRMDNFPLTTMEAQACGLPAVAFDHSGLSFQISHKSDGYLAADSDVEDFSWGVDWILNHPNPSSLASRCIKRAHSRYSEELISTQLNEVYEHEFQRFYMQPDHVVASANDVGVERLNFREKR